VNRRTIAGFVAATALVFLGFYFLSPAVATALGTAAVALSGVYSVRVLAALVPQGQVPAVVRRLLARLRLI
jgi:PST family polysaccharide transporter